MVEFRRLTRHIISVGVELEGGICESDAKALGRRFGLRFNYGFDGSVNVRCSSRCCENWVWDAELRYWSHDYDDLVNFVRTVFSTSFKQNETCGNHMHFKINVPATLIMLPEFYHDYITEYRRFAEKQRNAEKYLNRLISNFCRADPETINNNLWCELRYAAINFVSLLEPQGTVEVRIMPYAESASEYISMLNFNIHILDKLILKYTKKHKARITIKDVITPKRIRLTGEL